MSRIWYIADCLDCVMKMPFASEIERNEWAAEHSAPHEDAELHTVRIYKEVQ